MPDVRDDITQLGEALVISEVHENFKKLAEALKTDKGVSMTIYQSYMSKYDIVGELRLLVKDKTDKPPSNIKPLLTSDKKMEDIIAENNYVDLYNYLYELGPADFEPPLPGDFISKSGVSVKQFPNKMDMDPRRTGRVVIPGPTDILKSTEVEKWLLNNSVLYGYVPYSNNALFYFGNTFIRAKVNSAVDKQDALNKLILTFVNSNTNTSQISISYEQLIDKTVQATPAIAAESNLDYIVDNKTLSNQGTILDLVVIDNQPVWKGIAQAYIEMYNAAKQDGISLKISSGYRPALGPTQTATTNKGATITLTTQESIRRDKGRWINRSSFAGSDEEFIMKAPSSFFHPATAPPKSSRHGDGLALDLNTGGRDVFKPLQPNNYIWLIKNSYKYGFIRTVGSEEWHFEYKPDLAKNGPYAALPQADDGHKFYTDLGLSKGQFQV